MVHGTLPGSEKENAAKDHHRRRDHRVRRPSGRCLSAGAAFQIHAKSSWKALLARVFLLQRRSVIAAHLFE